MKNNPYQAPPSLFYKKQSHPPIHIQLTKASQNQIANHPQRPYNIQTDQLRSIPSLMKQPEHKKYINFEQNIHLQNLSTGSQRNFGHQTSGSRQRHNLTHNYQQKKHPLINDISTPHQTASLYQNSTRTKQKNPNTPIFHPSYFLGSNFPLLGRQDILYMPIILRLQNSYTKYVFYNLYVNIKFLLVQPDDQFWKYLVHLSTLAVNGLNQQQIRKGYRLRIAIQSCLRNFTVKQFNKYISVEQSKQSSDVLSVKIYQYQTIFSSKSFKVYQNLMDAILQFYERLLQARNSIQKSIITDFWYLDTLKALNIAMIYGNFHPKRVKNIVSKMFQVNKQLFTKDFVVFYKVLLRYIDGQVNSITQQKYFSLLQSLNRQIEIKFRKQLSQSSNYRTNSTALNEFMNICFQCIKLFIFVKDIFKFFPSQIKLIFMRDTQFLTIMTKISIKIVLNLKQHTKDKKSKWKLPEVVRQKIRPLQFLVMDQICQMYKFMFFNAKKAVQMQITSQQTSNVENRKIIFKFYKKLIELLANKVKDTNQQKDFSTQFGKQQKIEFQHSKKSQKQDVKDKKRKKRQKQKFQKQYGRVILQFLLIKQLKKNESQYLKVPYFYTLKLLQYFKGVQNNAQNISTEVQKQQPQSQSQMDSNLVFQKRGQKNLYHHIKLLQQLQASVKEKYLKDKQLSKRFKDIDLMFRKLPSLKQFNIMQEIKQRQQLKRKLNEFKRQYEDEPTQEEQLDFIAQQKLKDQEDFTLLVESDFNISNTSSINFTNKNKRFAQDQTDKTIYWQQDQHRNIYGLSGRHNKNILNVRKLINDQQQQLSPEQISEAEISQFLNDSKIGDNLSFASITSFGSIFKPHQSMKKVKQSMVKQQLDYFQRIKDLSWNQISRISMPKNNTKQKDTSFIQQNSFLCKVEDIGLSFDMVLDDDQGSSEFNQNGSNSMRYSHFYFDQFKGLSTQNKKKSFMNDYQWSNANQYQQKQQIMEQQEEQRPQRFVGRTHLKHNYN